MKMKMTKFLCLLVFLLAPAAFAHADLNAYLQNLNISAQGDRSGFIAQLGARFHIGQADVNVLLSNVDNPADAALVLWLGEKSGLSRDRVLRTYQEEKSHGWGAVARSLGIKPGSSEFHALKEGNLDFSAPQHHAGKSKNNREHGKSKGRGKKR